MTSADEARAPKRAPAPRTAVPRATKSAEKPPDRFICDFCDRCFSTDKSLLAHACEPKRRAMQRDDKHVQLGFKAYRRFFEQRMARSHKPPGYDAFAKSSLYLAFVRFGSYLLDIHAVNPFGFIDFLIRTEVPIDRWRQPTVYETYVRELNKNELPVEALERTLPLLLKWAEDTGNDWTDFFRRVAPSQATLWIKSGRLSPWILLTAPSAPDLLARLSPEQADIINAAINAGFWEVKVQRHRDAAETIAAELAAAGL